MHRNIIKDTGTVPAGFTGIIYNDTGRLNYASAINGMLLRRHDGKARWFASDMAAAKAIDKVDGGKTTWTTRI